MKTQLNQEGELFVIGSPAKDAKIFIQYITGEEDDLSFNRPVFKTKEDALKAIDELKIKGLIPKTVNVKVYRTIISPA